MVIAFCSHFSQGQMKLSLPLDEVTDEPFGTNLTIKTARLANGVDLQYAEQGIFTGTAVLFLHGLGDSWHSFETVLAALPHNIHAFAISLRGHGDSEKPTAGYTMKDFATDVAQFVKVQDLKSVYVVGHSMGGLVAQQFVLDHPQLIKGMVLIDSDAIFNDNAGFPEFFQETLKLQGSIDKKFMDDFQRSTLAKPIDPAYYDLLVAEGLKVPAAVFKSGFAGLMQADFRDELEKIKVPVVIFWGDRDSMCSLEDEQQLLRGLPHAKFMIYENTGHALHWEEPTRFANDLSSFINSTR